LKGKLSFETTNNKQQHIMKKSIIALSVAALGVASVAKAALPLDDISVSVTFGYESEYVFRGAKLDQQAFQPAIDVEYGNFYAGIWNTSGISTNSATGHRETNFYGGYAFALDDQITLDFGATYYYYSQDDGATFELYAGAAWDVLLEPAGYIYYDFDLKAWTFELSAGHSIEVADKTSLDFSGHLGYQRFSRSGDLEARFNHFYAGIAADLTYAFTDYASFSIGPRLSSSHVRSSGDGRIVRQDPAVNRDLLWWGAAFTAGF
jgi:uncharacterized protein (TIGR02001 family)